MCKVQSYLARQRGTSGKRIGSGGGLEVIGAMLGGEPEAGVEGEQEAKAEGKAGGLPLTVLEQNVD